MHGCFFVRIGCRSELSAIAVEFVEDEELKVLRCFDDLVVECEDEVEHHVVRKKNVRRVLFDAVTFFLALLPSVAAVS